MKAMLREFWLSWQTATFIAGWSVAMVVLIALGLWLQRADIQRRLDQTAIKSIAGVQEQQADIMKALEVIRAQNQRSIDDRRNIHSTIEKIKKEETKP